jgi:hypothetical protein
VVADISAEDLIRSLGDTASFGTLKKLLKKGDGIEVADVRLICVLLVIM